MGFSSPSLVPLCRGFSIAMDPEVILARELAAGGEAEGAKENRKVQTIIWQVPALAHSDYDV